MKMSKLKVIGPQSDHEEIYEALSTYFKVLREGRLRPANEGNDNFVGYYVLGSK